MKMDEKHALYAYLLNRESYYRYEYDNLASRTRYRKVNVDDITEFLVARSRLDDFVQFRKDVLELLHLPDFDEDTLTTVLLKKEVMHDIIKAKKIIKKD